jgi:multiple sugar transport system substrate-binding protein
MHPIRLSANVSRLLILALLLAACTPAATPVTPAATAPPATATTAPVTELTFLAQGGDDDQGEIFETLTQQFNNTVGQELGIHVTYKKVPADWPEYTQKLVAQIAAGNPPDVVNLSPLLKPDFIANNYLLDMRPLMDADGTDLSQWYPPTFDSWTDDAGHIYGFGHGIYTEAIFYNKTLFDEAGLEVPSLAWDNSWTWDEFADYARQLTKGEGAERQYGFFIEPQLGWMTPLFRSFCGNIGKPDGSGLTLNSEGSVAALQFLTDLMWTDDTAPGSDVTSATSAYDLFMAGRLAMFLDGSWYMPSFADITDFEWGVLPLPKGECGTFTGYWVDAFAIPAASAHTAEAYQFIKFMVGTEASNAYVDRGMFGIPSLVSAAEARSDEMFRPLTGEAAQVWLDSANYGATPEYTYNWNEVWDATNKIFQRIELGEITAAEAGQLMVDEADRLITAVTGQ